MRRRECKRAYGDIVGLVMGKNAFENFLLEVTATNRSVVGTSIERLERLGIGSRFGGPEKHVNRIRMWMK